MPGYAHSKPDEWEYRVWQPVHPTEASDACFLVPIPVHPNVEEFVRAQPRDVVHPKSLRLKEFASNVKVALEGRDPPTDRPVGQHRTACPVLDSHVTH